MEFIEEKCCILLQYYYIHIANVSLPSYAYESNFPLVFLTKLIGGYRDSNVDVILCVAIIL